MKLIIQLITLLSSVSVIASDDSHITRLDYKNCDKYGVIIKVHDQSKSELNIKIRTPNSDHNKSKFSHIMLVKFNKKNELSLSVEPKIKHYPTHKETKFTINKNEIQNIWIYIRYTNTGYPIYEYEIKLNEIEKSLTIRST